MGVMVIVFTTSGTSSSEQGDSEGMSVGDVTSMTERLLMLHKYVLPHLDLTVCCDILSFRLHDIMSAFKYHGSCNTDHKFPL